MEDDFEWPPEFEERTKNLYDEFFSLVNDKVTTHTGIEIAGTMIGIAMRLYRTALDDYEYNNIIDYVYASKDSIDPFPIAELVSTSIH